MYVCQHTCLSTRDSVCSFKHVLGTTYFMVLYLNTYIHWRSLARSMYIHVVISYAYTYMYIRTCSSSIHTCTCIYIYTYLHFQMPKVKPRPQRIELSSLQFRIALIMVDISPCSFILCNQEVLIHPLSHMPPTELWHLKEVCVDEYIFLLGINAHARVLPCAGHGKHMDLRCPPWPPLP